MNALLTKLGLGTALAATTLAVAAPAEARRSYRDRDDAAAAAALARIAGLAIGAAIASDRDRYYDDDYYDYPPPRRFYGPRYADPYRGYWGPPRVYYRDCRVRRVYDPYLGRRVRVRYC